MFPIKLVEFLNAHKVNTVCWVVSALTMISSFKTFEKIKPAYLHTIAFGSEVFPIKQFKIWRAALPEAKFANLYGPTECTGMSCYYHVDRDFELDEALRYSAIRQDARQAFEWFQRAARHSTSYVEDLVAKGKYLYARCFVDGLGTDFDRDKSVRLMLAAQKSGSAEATAYIIENGITEDMLKATDRKRLRKG